MADHIIQKKNESTWYVRLDIPKDVRRAFGNRTVLIKSLKTGMRSEAMASRLPILAQWKADIAAARSSQKADRGNWQEKVHAKSNAHRHSVDIAFLDAIRNPPRGSANPTIQGIAERSAKIDAEKAALLRDLRRVETETGARGLVERLEAGFINTEPTTLTDGVQAADEITQHFIAEMARVQYNLSPVETTEAKTIIVEPRTYKPRSPISTSMIDEWTKHLATQIKSEKTRNSCKARVEKISKFLTTEGAPLNFDTIHKFLNKQGGASQTLANYVWSGRSFWKWAVKYNSQFREQFTGQPCPFDGHDLPKTGDAVATSYLAFSRKEVEDLHKKAREYRKDDLANLIIFGAYTAARLEEIGRIKPQDTIYDNDGEPIGFKIIESKTDAGVREMPLHPSLVTLYKQLCTQASVNDGYLFKGGKNKYGNRLDWLSKQFGHLKTKAHFSKLHVFHSIRKTTTTELHQAGVGLEVLPYILGHENKSFTLNIYSGGCSFEQKKKAIQLLHFEFEK